MTRHEAREQAFFVLFDKLFDEEATVEEIIEKAGESELIRINQFARALLGAAEANAEEIDEVLCASTVGWTLTRLPKVSLAILRLAVAEMKYLPEVPLGVSVNEAVELAKTYGTSEDASYINGVLGTVARAKDE